jgi:outer membrane biosynthesis protein TonB
MRLAYTISGFGHAAILLWSIWSLAAKPLPAPSESLPVDLITVSELTQMTAGSKDAAKTEATKPLAEKVDAAKPAEDVTAKVVEKKEVKAVRDPPPAAEVTPTDAKPAKAETIPDPIAEAPAKEPEKKTETKKAEAKTPTPPKKPAPPSAKFDPHKVADLLDKRNPTRLAAAAPEPGSTPAVGLPTAHAKTLSLSELDALRQRLHQYWTVPAAKDPKELISVFRIKLRPDGRLAEPPMLISGRDSQLAMVARENAARAIFRGQPYDMLKPENYELWKDIEITFDPRDM